MDCNLYKQFVSFHPLKKIKQLLFAMDRFFTYDKDITKMKSEVLPIIEEWEEE